MDITFLAQADAVTLQLEKAKRALEAAKADLETAKKNYDELLAQADDMGIPKAKLKKLTEDRIQMLFDSGLMDFVPSSKEAKAARKPKVAKAVKADAAAVEAGRPEAAAVESSADSDDDEKPVSEADWKQG